MGLAALGGMTGGKPGANEKGRKVYREVEVKANGWWRMSGRNFDLCKKATERHSPSRLRRLFTMGLRCPNELVARDRMPQKKRIS